MVSNMTVLLGVSYCVGEVDWQRRVIARMGGIWISIQWSQSRVDAGGVGHAHDLSLDACANHRTQDLDEHSWLGGEILVSINRMHYHKSNNLTLV